MKIMIFLACCFLAFYFTLFSSEFCLAPHNFFYYASIQVLEYKYYCSIVKKNQYYWWDTGALVRTYTGR